MTVENISRSISMKECCRPRGGGGGGGVEPATSWSPVRRHIQLSHRGGQDGRVIMRASVQWRAVQSWAGFCLQQDSSLGPHDSIDWVELLWPSQPIRVMSTTVSLPNHTFPGHAYSSKWLTSTCAHSFTRNWQLPFLNQQKGQNGHRKYFIVYLHNRKLPDSAGKEPVSFWSPYLNEPPRPAWSMVGAQTTCRLWTSR